MQLAGQEQILLWPLLQGEHLYKLFSRNFAKMNGLHVNDLLD